MSKRLVVLILSLLALVMIILIFRLPIGAWLRELVAWADRLGPWGPVVLVAMSVVASVLLLPGSILTLGAGFLYGVPLGFLIVWIANMLGACAAFGMGRSIRRGPLARRMLHNEKFATLDEGIGEHGFKVVFLIRLSPVFPFGLLNYAFGASGVSFRQYVLGSLLGLIPGILMFVYIGASLRPLADGGVIGGYADMPIVHQVSFWCGLAFTILLVVVATYAARRALAEVSQQRRHLPADAAAQPEGLPVHRR